MHRVVQNIKPSAMHGLHLPARSHVLHPLQLQRWPRNARIAAVSVCCLSSTPRSAGRTSDSLSHHVLQAPESMQRSAPRLPACGMCTQLIQPAPQRWQPRSEPPRRNSLTCSVDSDRNAPVDRGVPERLVTSIGLAALWAGIICESAYHAIACLASANDEFTGRIRSVTARSPVDRLRIRAGARPDAVQGSVLHREDHRHRRERWRAGASCRRRDEPMRLRTATTAKGSSLRTCR